MMRPSMRLSKSLYMKGLQCHKALYLAKFKPELAAEVPPEREAIFQSGREVGRLAYGLFPGGIEIPYGAGRLGGQVESTASLIKEGEGTIYEATLRHDDVLCKIDILHKGKTGWGLYEVKMSTGLKAEHIEDVSLQYFVASGAGLDISNSFLVHLDREYVKEGALHLNKLFQNEDITEEVRKRQGFVGKEILRLKEMLTGPEPDIDIGKHCFAPYECEFKGYCWEHVPEDSVFDLRGRGGADKYALYQRGILQMVDIPLDELSGRQREQVETTIDRRNISDGKKMIDFISLLEYPLHFLDFETIGPPVPRYDGTRPYQAIPFQYSLHIQEVENGEISHREYLADPGPDPRCLLAEQLLSDITDRGSILVYHAPFERGILRALAVMFPEYALRIEEITSRIIDLELPFKKRDVYFWKMKGSTSIKSVLPALVPDLSYEDLAIRNGNIATQSYMNICDSEDLLEIARVKRDLRKYCCLDTLAMVKILEKIRQIAEEAGRL